MEDKIKRVGLHLPGKFSNLTFALGASKVLFDVFRTAGIEIVNIVVNSTNAFTGLLLCVGDFSTLTNACLNIKSENISKIPWRKVFIHPFKRPSLLDNEPLKNYVEPLIDLDSIFNDRAIPLDIITADMMSGDYVLFTNKNPAHKDIFFDAIFSSSVFFF